jgi:hypothetical protein
MLSRQKEAAIAIQSAIAASAAPVGLGAESASRGGGAWHGRRDDTCQHWGQAPCMIQSRLVENSRIERAEVDETPRSADALLV